MLMEYRKKRALCHGSQFCTGSVAYGALEVLWRGYTHISMLFLGGVCFCVLIAISKRQMNFALKCLVGGLFISAAEFIMGCVVNLMMGLSVWDYSQEACQLYGQVCARYSLLWCVLSALVIPLCCYWRKLFVDWQPSRLFRQHIDDETLVYAKLPPL